MTGRTTTQKEALLALLLKGEEITAVDALDRLGCFRLASRIHDLKVDGLDIETRTVKTPGGARISAYKLRAYQPELV